MIGKKPILQALQALRRLVENYEASGKKKSLLQEDHELYLQVTMKKIPKLKSMKRIKVALPHPLIKETDEVCLIVGDLDKKNRKADIEPDILHYKELLEKHGIKEINEVVTLRQLRTEYKQYEAKQKLLAAYDVFLADNKITECLPNVLGKHFFTKRKFPIQINIHTSNLKQQIERALSTKVFQITGRGNSCTCEVACLSMDDEDIVENVVAMANTLSDQLPGCWKNVMGLYLKTSLSKAIPLYVSYDDPNEVEFDEVEDDVNAEIDELSTMPHMNVKVYNDGRVEVLNIKDRIQEDVIKAENESLSESIPAEGVKENINSEESSLEDINSKKNELPGDSIPAENIKKSPKLKKRKSKNSSLTDNFILEKNEIPDDNPAEVPVEDMKKSTKSKKRKSQVFSLMEDFNSELEKSELHNDSEPVKKMKKGLKSKREKAQECSLKKDEFPNDSPAEVPLEDKKSSTKSKKRKSQDISLMMDLISEKNELPQYCESVKKIKKNLKSKRGKAQDCSFEKNQFPHDTMSVKKTSKVLKSKRRKTQECSFENVISEKRKKNKEKHL